MSFTIGKNVAVVLVTVRMFGSLNPTPLALAMESVNKDFFVYLDKMVAV